MSVVAPVTALTGPMLPLIWGLADGDKLSRVAGVGVVLGLLAIVLISRSPDGRSHRPLDQQINSDRVGGRRMFRNLPDRPGQCRGRFRTVAPRLCPCHFGRAAHHHCIGETHAARSESGSGSCRVGWRVRRRRERPGASGLQGWKLHNCGRPQQYVPSLNGGTGASCRSGAVRTRAARRSVDGRRRNCVHSRGLRRPR